MQIDALRIKLWAGGRRGNRSTMSKTDAGTNRRLNVAADTPSASVYSVQSRE